MDYYFASLAILLVSVVGLWMTLLAVARLDKNITASVRAAHQRLLATSTVAAVAIALLGATYVVVHTPPHQARADVVGLVFVGFFSGLVGFTEIAQRYTDRPVRLMTVSPALVYVYINIAAGVATLALVDKFQVFAKTTPHATLYKVLLASFGAVAFFRSSFFTARVGTVDVDIGPATLLKGLLSLTDQLINRWQAADRAETIADLMRKVDFTKARQALPALCLTVVENLSEDQQAACAQSIARLERVELDPVQRSILLGVYLTRLVGPDVLTRAVFALRETIVFVATQEPPTNGPPAAEPPLTAATVPP